MQAISSSFESLMAVMATTGRTAELAQGALKRFDFAFVVDLLPLRQFQCLEDFVHFIKGVF